MIPDKTAAKNEIGSLKSPPELLLTGDAFDEVKVITTGVMMDVPKGKTHETFHNFVNLPSAGVAGTDVSCAIYK